MVVDFEKSLDEFGTTCMDLMADWRSVPPEKLKSAKKKVLDAANSMAESRERAVWSGIDTILKDSWYHSDEERLQALRNEVFFSLNPSAGKTNE